MTSAPDQAGCSRRLLRALTTFEEHENNMQKVLWGTAVCAAFLFCHGEAALSQIEPTTD